MQRFFVPPSVYAQPVITLIGDQAHQVRRVLRLRPGDRVVLLDGQGSACEAALIAADEDGARFEVVRRWEATGEPAIHITLFQAALKGERFGWALQKGTEVGVAAFVPLICARNVVDDLAAIEHKRERWERIIREAAEQSGRGRLPTLYPARSFVEIFSPENAPFPRSEKRAGEEGAIRIVLWEGEHKARLRDVLNECNLAAGTHIQVFVGPEGGLTADEIAAARCGGAYTASLGPRILRAETAGVIAAALILYTANDI